MRGVPAIHWCALKLSLLVGESLTRARPRTPPRIFRPPAPVEVKKAARFASVRKIKCCIHDGFVYFPRFRGNVEFLYCVFASGALYGGLGKLGTQLSRNADTVGSIRMGWPPEEDEQLAIVHFLNKATVELDHAITSAQEEIALIREYRTRLIADIVTGKLDVRQAAANLPEEAKDLENWGENDVTDDD